MLQTFGVAEKKLRVINQVNVLVHKAEIWRDSIPMCSRCLSIDMAFIFDANANLIPDFGLRKDKGYQGYIYTKIPTVGRSQSLITGIICRHLPTGFISIYQLYKITFILAFSYIYKLYILFILSLHYFLLFSSFHSQ